MSLSPEVLCRGRDWRRPKSRVRLRCSVFFLFVVCLCTAMIQSDTRSSIQSLIYGLECMCTVWGACACMLVKEAIELAKEAERDGEVPVGAVVVGPNGP